MSNFRNVKVVVRLIQKGIIQKKFYITEHNKNDEDDFEDFLSMGTIFQDSGKEGDDNHKTGRGRSDKNSEKTKDSNEDESYHIHENGSEHHKNDEDDFEDFLSMGTIFQESGKKGDDNHIRGKGRSDKNSTKSRDSNEDETYHIREDESEVVHMDSLEKLSKSEGNEALSLVDVLIRLKS